MKIVVATPLYPPEIAEPAPYTKELAWRLANSHEITIVAYARLPEPIAGVHIVAIDKRNPLPIRLVAYFFALWSAARSADIVYAENGASVELPAALVALLSGRPLIFHIGDRAAHERALHRPAAHLIESFARKIAHRTVESIPLPRPEILPLDPAPIKAQTAYEASWALHLAELESQFNHA